MSLGSINIRIGGSTVGLEKALSRAERSLNRSARKFDRIGSQLSSTFTVPLAAAGVASVKLAADIQSSFGKIENLVGVTGAALEKMKEGVASLSGPVGKSQKELSEALFVVTSAGAKGAKAMEILESAAKASAIGLGETKDVAKATTAILASYGDGIYTAATATNVLTKIVREGNLEASELAPALGRVVGLAAKMGVSFEELGANVATFTKLGVSSEEAITGISGLLSGLLKPTKQGAEALDQVGMSFEGLRNSIKTKGLAATLNDLMTAFKGNDTALAAVIPNVRALRTVLGTSGVQMETYNQVLANISDGLDVVDSGFEKVSQSANFKFNQALVNLQNAGIEIGSKLLPVVTRIIESVSSLATSFSNLSPATQSTIIKVGGFVAAAGPLLKVVGSMNSLLGLSVGAFRGVVGIAGKANVALTLMGTSLAGVLGPIGIAVTALYGLKKVVDAVSGSMDENAIMQEKAAAASRSVQQEAGKEQLIVNDLFKVVGDYTKSTEDRQKALDDLKAAYPKYLGDMTLEQATVENLKIAQDGLNESILKSVANRKKAAIRNEAAEKEIELLTRIQDLESGAKSTWGEFFANKWTDSATAGEEAIERYRAEIEEVRMASEKATGAIDNLFNKPQISRGTGRFKPGKKSASPAKVEGGSTSGLSNMAKVAREAVAEVELLDSKVGLLNVSTIESGNSTTAWGEVLATLPGKITPTEDALTRLHLQMENNRVQMQEFSVELTAIVEGAFNNAAVGIGMALGGLAAGTTTLGEVGKAAIGGLANVLIDVGKLAIKTGIAMKGIQIALDFGGPFAAIAAGTALVAVGAAVKAGISKKVPKLAKGGLAYGPTYAMVGDNPGAKTDPEVISPLSKLKSIIAESQPQQSGGNFSLEHRISGEDLIILLKRAGFTRDRTFA